MARDGLRRIASGRLFQARGAATAKVRSPIVVRRVAGTMRSADDAGTKGSEGMERGDGKGAEEKSPKVKLSRMNTADCGISCSGCLPI